MLSYEIRSKVELFSASGMRQVRSIRLKNISDDRIMVGQSSLNPHLSELPFLCVFLCVFLNEFGDGAENDARV